MTDPNIPFPSNSKKAKYSATIPESFQPQDDNTTVPLERDAPPQASVVKGRVVVRKKGIGSKIRDMFTGDDARNVGSYIVLDVVTPAIRDMVIDAVQQGIERFIMGDSRPSRPRSSVGWNGGGGSSSKSHVSYNRMSDRSIHRPESTREITRMERSQFDFSNIILDERADAEFVLDKLRELINKYGVANVGNFYELVNITPDFTNNKFGWDNLNEAVVRRARGGGYVILLPEPMEIR